MRNTGPTAITGDVGVSPWPTVAGLPDGTVRGSTYRADKTAIAAKAALVAAYYDAAGRAATAVGAALESGLLAPGIYNAGAGPLNVTGRVVLDAAADPTSVWVFQTTGDMTTSASSAVVLVNGAQAGNVFWQVAGSASLGSGSGMVGTIMTLGSITLGNGVGLAGRALARDGSVTMLNNAITGPGCASPGAVHAALEGGSTHTLARALVNTAAYATPSAPDPGNADGSYQFLGVIGLLVLVAVLLGEAPDRRRGRFAT